MQGKEKPLTPGAASAGFFFVERGRGIIKLRESLRISSRGGHGGAKFLFDRFMLYKIYYIQNSKNLESKTIK